MHLKCDAVSRDGGGMTAVERLQSCGLKFEKRGGGGNVYHQRLDNALKKKVKEEEEKNLSLRGQDYFQTFQLPFIGFSEMTHGSNSDDQQWINALCPTPK